MGKPNMSLVWVVSKTNDDGRPVERVGVCSSEAKARIVASTLGGWGIGGHVASRRAILHPDPPEADSSVSVAYIIDGDPMILDEHVTEKIIEELREKALCKLSAEEREALGLPEPKPPVEVYDRT